jgi:hypothetical protein
VAPAVWDFQPLTRLTPAFSRALIDPKRIANAGKSAPA